MYNDKNLPSDITIKAKHPTKYILINNRIENNTLTFITSLPNDVSAQLSDLFSFLGISSTLK